MWGSFRLTLRVGAGLGPPQGPLCAAEPCRGAAFLGPTAGDKTLSSVLTASILQQKHQRPRAQGKAPIPHKPRASPSSPSVFCNPLPTTIPREVNEAQKRCKLICAEVVLACLLYPRHPAVFSIKHRRERRICF